ncbi:MAG: NAD-dependent epimerase/dehydratase family protein [Spirochaetes bacterium]|nr:NAD-dependent epimerase/dehydratase family protein [Spirochaetota bacterium]
MANILITGGAGFIGSHLARQLAADGHDVIIYDNLSSGRLENIRGVPHRFIRGDITNLKKLERAVSGCEYVCHLAALISVVESMERSERYITVNAGGTVNVLEAARRNGVKKIIYASSAAVYGDSPELPKTEEMRPEPMSPYAVTKLDGEYYCAMYREAHGLSTVCARFFNVFGERQDPNSPYAAAVPIFATRALAGEPITVYGDGEQTRDFVYVGDVARALAFFIDRGEGIYNIGYGTPITVNRLVADIIRHTQSRSEIRHAPDRPGEVKHSCASIRRLLGAGFSISGGMADGLERTLRWFDENR